MKYLAILAVFSACIATLVFAAESAEESTDSAPMSNKRLQALIDGVADSVEGRPGYWRFSLSDFNVTVITDESADRMRIIVPVARTEDIGDATLMRLMQANFDSALDARYSIAKGVLWSAFIHPLSALSDHQFIDGLAQTVNLAATYGSTFSSGALLFGGGDSKSEQNKYYRDIIERGGTI